MIKPARTLEKFETDFINGRPEAVYKILYTVYKKVHIR